MSTLTYEVDFDVPAPIVWAALEQQNATFPKVAPHVFSNIEHLEGPHGLPGAIRKITFGPIAPEGAYVKEKLLAVDTEKFTATFEEIEGGHLTKGYTKWVTTVTLVPVGDNNSKLLVSTEYQYEDVLKNTKEGMTSVMKALGEFLKTESVSA